MKSTIQYHCPVTNKRTRVNLPGSDEDGVFLPVTEEDEDGLDLPLGWGRLVIEQVVRNPEVEQAKAARRAFVEQTTAAVEQQARGDSEQAAQIRAEIESGAAAEQIQAAAEEQIPIPEDATVTMRATYSVLSDEAIAEILSALEKAGVKFTVGGGE